MRREGGGLLSLSESNGDTLRASSDDEIGSDGVELPGEQRVELEPGNV